MPCATGYASTNCYIGWDFPLSRLAWILVGSVVKWGCGKPGWNSYPIMAIVIFTILASGAVPWWDYRRVTQAVARGEAKQVEGPIHDWRMARARGKRRSTEIGRASCRERGCKYV